MSSFSETAPKVVAWLSEMMPPGGEDGFRIKQEGRTLRLDLLAGDQTFLSVMFQHVMGVYSASVPGIDFTNFETARVKEAGELVEFTESAVATNWMKHAHVLNGALKHYQLLLLNENQRIDVIATGFEVVRDS